MIIPFFIDFLLPPKFIQAFYTYRAIYRFTPKIISLYLIMLPLIAFWRSSLDIIFWRVIFNSFASWKTSTECSIIFLITHDYLQLGYKSLFILYTCSCFLLNPKISIFIWITQHDALPAFCISVFTPFQHIPEDGSFKVIHIQPLKLLLHCSTCHMELLGH